MNGPNDERRPRLPTGFVAPPPPLRPGGPGPWPGPGAPGVADPVVAHPDGPPRSPAAEPGGEAAADPGRAVPGPGRAAADPGGLPLLPGFREMAVRRMAGERRRMVAELTARRQAAGLSQTQVAAWMGTSQSSVARIEAGHADVRATTLERYAAAVGSELSWRLSGDHTPGGT